MMEFLSCAACGTRVANDRTEINQASRCEKCGAVISPMSSDWNPYDPPSAPVGGKDEGITAALEVPPSVFGKFGLAFRLLGYNFLLFSLIILTVWLPANIALESFTFNAPEDGQEIASIRLNSLIQGVFGPISLGALIFAVSKRMQGEKVGYIQAMAVGFRNWGRLVAANFFAGMFILLGFIVFIVPGIILAVRYSLLDSVVILERPSDPRQRSTTLTTGRRWRIFGAGVLFFTFFIPSSFAVALAVDYVQAEVDWLNNLWVSAGTDCLVKVVESMITIVMLLFYLEARHHELTKSSDPDEGEAIFTKITEPL